MLQDALYESKKRNKQHWMALEVSGLLFDAACLLQLTLTPVAARARHDIVKSADGTWIILQALNFILDRYSNFVCLSLEVWRALSEPLEDVSLLYTCGICTAEYS